MILIIKGQRYQKGQRSQKIQQIGDILHVQTPVNVTLSMVIKITNRIQMHTIDWSDNNVSHIK